MKRRHGTVHTASGYPVHGILHDSAEARYHWSVPRRCRRPVGHVPLELQQLPRIEPRVPWWARPPRWSVQGPVATVEHIMLRVKLARVARLVGGQRPLWVAELGALLAADAAGRRSAVNTDPLAALVARDFPSSTVTELEHWIINSQASMIADLIAYDDTPHAPLRVWPNPWLPASAAWPFR